MIREEGRTLRVTAIHDISEHKRVRSKLRHDAIHDPLTGLKNRAAFIAQLQHDAQRVKRYPEHGFAVLFLDFDRFKSINDTFGHHVGDELLVAISQRLLSSLRGTDTVARLGGDEFIVLLDGVTRLGDAEAAAQKLLNGFTRPFLVRHHRLEIDLSIGIALSTSSPEHPEYLIRNADAAMYRAKARGKAQYASFDERLQLELSQQLAVEKNLRQAVQRGAFTLLYQPIVSLTDNRVVGVEALVRWPQPDGSLMLPEHFIPIAEETGLIIPLGQWVLEEACRQLSLWRRETNTKISVHVNLSTKQFLQDDLALKVAATLKSVDLPASALRLEITESALVTNPEQAVQTMDEFEKIGVNLHVDDFGTGYSSLSYLHTFPLSALKIDRSFVTDMEQPKSVKVIEAIHALAASLNMSVIAEGIETDAQLERLKALGCQYAQGYKIAQPLRPDTFRALL